MTREEHKWKWQGTQFWGVKLTTHLLPVYGTICKNVTIRIHKIIILGECGSVVVEALCYKPEDRG
jgi:hypothetical protein